MEFGEAKFGSRLDEDCDSLHHDCDLQHRARGVRRVLLSTMVLNLAMCLLKGVAGVMSGSVALVADALHTLLDAGSNVVGLATTGIAQAPPDDDHNYGHRKVEVIGALVIGLLVLVGAIEIGREAITGFLNGSSPEVSGWTIGVAGLSIVVSLGVSLWERRAGKVYKSSVLKADAAHTMSDAASSLVVMGGLIGTWYGVAGLDLVCAFAVMTMVVFTGYRIVRDAIFVLVDGAQVDPDEVVEVASAVPGLKSCHNVRSRGTREHVQLDLHVTFDPNMRLADAGRGVCTLRDELHAAFPQVEDIVIQLEPHLPAYLDDTPTAAF